jgi:hypothetical protein
MDEVVETAAPVESSDPEAAPAPSVPAVEPAPVSTIQDTPAEQDALAVPVPDETVLTGKTVESVQTYQRASVTVIDILGTNGVHYFVKVAHNQAEVGGTEVWGTGVLQA